MPPTHADLRDLVQTAAYLMQNGWDQAPKPTMATAVREWLEAARAALETEEE